MRKTLDTLVFDNRFTRELPADPELDNYRRQVSGACFSRVQPSKVSRPRLVAYAREVAEELNFSQEFCKSQIFTEMFSGNSLHTDMDPYATCYGGHQFGNWAGQLGDGRAINLGEIVSPVGKRWVLQLKGAGPTPYSRTADGLAVLRSSVREFLCSEAMYHLGVPTTRALSLVLTGEQVVRDMFYDGHPKYEPGAVVCRVAPSFTRFGSFQIFASRGEIDVLQQLVDYTIRTDFPHLGDPSTDVYLKWFAEVCQRTLTMVLHWERVGFVHGVMNTDNMSILGLTIDYGPYGWLEDYDPNWTPNTTDASGRRYCFGNQTQIAMWNLGQFAQALLPIIPDTKSLQQILDHYPKDYTSGWNSMMAQKLGFKQFEAETDSDLIEELLAVLQLTETDMTIYFRKLALLDFDSQSLNTQSDTNLIAPLMEAYYIPKEMNNENKKRTGNWLRLYLKRLARDGRTQEERFGSMNAINPKYVLRNYLAQLAIDQSEQGDHSLVCELLDVLRNPYDEQQGKEKFAKKRPEWARHKPGCSMLSCSS
ncbi:MAG: YdiU family protein [Thiothrix sp.]|nr:MAG: YdiU family protein [Thiothrix sp.]